MGEPSRLFILGEVFKISIIAELILAVIVGLGAGIGIGSWMKAKATEGKVRDAEAQAQRIIQDAEKEAENKCKSALLELKDKFYQTQVEFEKEMKDRRNELNNIEKRLLQREEHHDKKLDQLDKREAEMGNREKTLKSRETAMAEKEVRFDEGLRQQKEMLERIAGMGAEEAKRELMLRVEEEAKLDVARMVKRIEEESKETAERKAKELIALAVQRYASDYVAETTVSVVAIPSDEMKGRIIGREGRNIRALEGATGVDLIIDDTPEAVVISGHDPVRREIAKRAIERLASDGRIHPTRIEEVVEKVRKEIDTTIREEGEKAIFDLALGGIHQETMKLLGRLRFRTSYGQNVLMHSREVAFIAGIMAAELGVDVKMAKRAGLLHDIGKAVDHEVEGTHSSIGAELAKKYGEPAKVINAILSHHGDEEASCVESVLVAAADALSAARPGARRETLESYIKRLEKLEQVAHSFKGVEKAYAIQAGREIRVIVKPEDMDDALSAQISREMAKKIEKELTYPGQIKVTVVRESRFVEYAK